MDSMIFTEKHNVLQESLLVSCPELLVSCPEVLILSVATELPRLPTKIQKPAFFFFSPDLPSSFLAFSVGEWITGVKAVAGSKSHVSKNGSQQLLHASFLQLH